MWRFPVCRHYTYTHQARCRQTSSTPTRQETLLGKEAPVLFRNVVVPYDLSESAKNALREAVAIVKLDPTASLHVIYVYPFLENRYYLPAGNGSLDMQPAYYNLEHFKKLRDEMIVVKTKAVRDDIGPIIDGLDNEVTIEVIDGTSAAPCILDYAHDHDCDLIVIGCRGLSAIRGMLGSVSYNVVRNAEIPVMIVK
jgi:nucleotide-binding universal stress UspA family protein